MARLVRFRVLDGIAVVTLDAAPVNALSALLRAGLWEVFSRIDTNPGIKAAVLMATGRLFSAGADIREFSEPASDPSLPQLCNHIEACSKPVVVAFHGQALGGGAELVLAAHYRLASSDASFWSTRSRFRACSGGRWYTAASASNWSRTRTSAYDHNQFDVALRIGLVDGIIQGDLGFWCLGFCSKPHRAREGAKTDA